MKKDTSTLSEGYSNSLLKRVSVPVIIFINFKNNNLLHKTDINTPIIFKPEIKNKIYPSPKKIMSEANNLPSATNEKSLLISDRVFYV
jgi:hypothetical protein